MTERLKRWWVEPYQHETIVGTMSKLCMVSHDRKLVAVVLVDPNIFYAVLPYLLRELRRAIRLKRKYG